MIPRVVLAVAGLASVAPAPPSSSQLLAARLSTDVGALPGAPALVVSRAADRTHCDGVAITVRHRRGAVDPEPELAAVMTLEPPRGLDFDPRPSHATARAASERRFTKFVTDAIATLQAAHVRYEADARRAATLELRIAATARLVQVDRRFAELLATMQIPESVRTGEFAVDASAAFCDALADKATPLADRADQEATSCRDLATGLAPGWWTPVCAEPAAVTP